MKKGLFDFKVADIVEIAILCSLAIVLDTFVKIPLGPSGSINLSMIPILIIALRHGWFKTLFAGGLVYGLITCLLDGYGFITYPLDYFLGFGSTCLLGLFAPYIVKNFNKDKKSTIMCFVFVILGTLSWGVVRFFASSLSSVLVYEYTFAAAFAYNLSYVFISCIADMVILCGLLYLIYKLNKVYPTTFIKQISKTKEVE